MRERGAVEDERQFELSLRPTRLGEYIGQKKATENLGIFIRAARARREALDHVLLTGPPGLGKTTLSVIIANEMGAELRSTAGPIIEKPGDLAALLTNLQEGDVLFIDEIHRMSPAIEEVLYPAMEDYQLDIMIGQGPSAKSIKLELPKFTLVGATTRPGLITAPLRGRFGIVFHLNFYTHEELAVHLVEAEGVDLHAVERAGGDLPRDAPVVLDLGEVADAPQQAVGDARGAARAPGDLPRPIRFDGDADDFRRASDD